MNSYRGNGRRLNKTVPTGGVSSGEGVVIRSGASGCIGIWVDDYSAAANGVVAMSGLHEVDCAAIAISQGDLVYWDVADGEVNKSATGNTLAGYCAISKATTAGRLVTIMLNGIPD